MLSLFPLNPGVLKVYLCLASFDRDLNREMSLKQENQEPQADGG